MHRHLLGRQAESFAAKLLIAQGWQVLHRNWRTPYAEIGLLAQDPRGILVLVEVKSRHPFAQLQGENLLRPAQRKRLGRALLWLQQRQAIPVRADLICVELIRDQPTEMTRYRDIDLA